MLGNGFSVACRPDSFAYGRLIDEAEFSDMNIDADVLFAREGTADFERVIEALRRAARIVELYGDGHPELCESIRADSDRIKQVLAETLAKKHPDHVFDISDGEYSSARRFLSNFGHVFTVNYDLLLYWALLNVELPPKFSSDDGFRADPENPDAEWVAWDHLFAFSQNIYHLHGGLHLFDGGSVLKKLTWSRTGVPLIDQIREALDAALYPLVVTEGSSDEKLDKILHHSYLARGLKSLSACKGTLFIYGHSLATNDRHVLDAIIRGKFVQIYVSLYGDPDSRSNRAIQKRALALSEGRSEKKPLAVGFFDAESAMVWTREAESTVHVDQ